MACFQRFSLGGEREREKSLQSGARSAWERECCGSGGSGGSGVPGSVLAAEMCPLDEPAAAAEIPSPARETLRGGGASWLSFSFFVLGQ